MKKIIAAAAIAAAAAGAAFSYLLYKIGEEMHEYRCGCHERDF